MLFVFFTSQLTQATNKTLTQLHMDVIFRVLKFNTFVPCFMRSLFVKTIEFIRFIRSILINNLLCQIILAKCISVQINNSLLNLHKTAKSKSASNKLNK